ncbi:MAG: prolyl oligopeptidase family serine peptidase [Gammaproteobacteria bacterium]|nr:prolyl oligopeptidase family serine peptidase [Gammaproteobacteria bacterium]
MKLSRHSRLASLLAAVIGSSLAAGPVVADDSMTEDGLSLEKIMQDPDWIGNQPINAYFADDNRTIYFQREAEDENFKHWYSIAANGGEATLLTPAQRADVPARGGELSQDGKRRVAAKNGDIFLYFLEEDRVQQLTRTSANESSPFFMADDRRIAWTVNGSTMIFDPASGLIEEAAVVKGENDPLRESENFDYLEDQQLRLFSTLRRENRRDESEKEHNRTLRDADPTRIAPTLYLGADRNIRFSSLSPNGRYMLVVSEPKSHENGKQDSMPNYVTESGYVKNRDVRPLVGLNAPAPHTIHLIDLEENSATTLAMDELPGIDDDPLEDLRDDAIDYHVEQGNDEDAVEKALKAPEIRPAQVEGLDWTRDGSMVAVQVHSVDNKDRWIATVDFDDGELESQHRLTMNKGWINWYHNDFGWLPDNRLWFLSEETGYSHLYVKRPGDRAVALTSGDYVVADPKVTTDGSMIYYIANPERSGTFNIYRVPTRAKMAAKQVSSISVQPSSRSEDDWGYSPFELSTDGEYLVFKHDEPTHPAELYAQAVNGGEPVKLTDSTSAEFKAVDWVAPEIVKVPSTHFDGTITARVYKPRDWSPDKEYPAVMFVHGAGYLHNAHDGWSVYFREFMFHNILLRHGYVVMDMDYRGSRGYGAKWRNAIYRQMGHPELEDLLDGKKYMVDNLGVNEDRVGVYGGSYGGFMAFMALFRSPGEWAAGAALRPVTDWAHYNHPYTSNILNTPLVDPMAYEKSSPIEWAEDYDNTPMLIAHGMQDDNVFFKDSVRLVQRLIELKKENFEIAPYPLDPHGFVHPESWLDEYRRIFKLMEENTQ